MLQSKQIPVEESFILSLFWQETNFDSFSL